MQIASTESIQVRFTVTDGSDSFTDALYFSPAEYAALTEEQLEAMKQARFAAWKAVATAPPAPVVPPTPEEIQAQIDSLTQQQRDTQTQLLALAPDDVMLGILEGQLALVQSQIAELSA